MDIDMTGLFWGKYNYDKYFKGDTATKNLLEIIQNAANPSDLDGILSLFSDYGELQFNLREAILSFLFNPLQHKEINKQALSFFSAFSEMMWYEWELLRRIFFGVGAIVLADFCRQQAEKLVLNEDSSNGNLILRKFSIALEHGDYAYAKEIIDKANIIGLNELFPDCYEGMIECLETLQKKLKNNDSYNEYVKGKTISLHGPAPHTDIYHPQENELCAHITYRGRSLLSKSDQHLPVDIAYYNKDNGKRFFLDNAVPDFVNDLKYIVYKDLGEPIKNMGTPSRMMTKAKFGCGFGYCLMVPYIIYDSLRYDIDQLYVRNVNFYYSKTAYDESYVSFAHSDNHATKKLLKATTIHDLIGNWLFTKSMYESGCFKADKMLDQVLKLSEADFVSGIESYFVEML